MILWIPVKFLDLSNSLLDGLVIVYRGVQAKTLPLHCTFISEQDQLSKLKALNHILTSPTPIGTKQKNSAYDHLFVLHKACFYFKMGSKCRLI